METVGMKFSRLLAKHTDDERAPKREETLVGHIEQVIEASMVLHKSLAEGLQVLLGPDFAPHLFEAGLFAAAWLHDIGKANDHFQEMIRDRHFHQGVRHETLGLVVISEYLDEALAPFWGKHPAWFKPAVLFAVAGHHLKFPDQKLSKRSKRDVTFLGGHPEIELYWQLGVRHLGLPPWKHAKNTKFSLLPFGGILEKLRRIQRQLDLDFSPAHKLFIAALKSTLMAADLAGSALPPREKPFDGWLRERLEAVLQGSQVADVVYQKVGQRKLRPFQEALARSTAHTVLVKAGCGSGKTIGAYCWCAQKADGKRLFFCYPTTATASEGFSGYLQDPDFEALLIHSRAAIDYKLLENMPFESDSQKEIHALKLEALDTWPVPAVVCTAHTVLGLLQNVRRALYAWPSLVRSVFVFDEIHAYSARLFRHLLRFLTIFKSHPALLMTATLPPDREEALREVCLSRGALQILDGPHDREEAKRYMLQTVSEEEAWEQTTQVLGDGGKVLWVSNTVGRTIARTNQAKDMALPVEPYHSRYRYRDRVQRQRLVIDAFAPGQPALLAMTTQVAEMSLDLSADLLITEYAPVPALIQRMGRLNRYQDVPETPQRALFIRPEDPLPYVSRKEEVAGFWADIERWLARMADGLPKSQRELGLAFVELTNEGSIDYQEDIFCDWLDDPWSTIKDRHAIMEAGYTLELVREEDLENGPLMENAIPMPFPKDKSWPSWPQKGRYLVAPAGTIEYDPFWGGCYAREKSLYRII
jgi:CRISPR-associated endonuclease/helicase Cas3